MNAVPELSSITVTARATVEYLICEDVPFVGLIYYVTLIGITFIHFALFLFYLEMMRSPSECTDSTIILQKQCGVIYMNMKFIVMLTLLC